MLSKFDQKEVERIKKIDIPHWQDDGSNFTSLLLQLIQKADNHNKYKIAQSYPNEVEAFRQWEAQRWAEYEQSQKEAEANG